MLRLLQAVLGPSVATQDFGRPLLKGGDPLKNRVEEISDKYFFLTHTVCAYGLFEVSPARAFRLVLVSCTCCPWRQARPVAASPHPHRLSMGGDTISLRGHSLLRYTLVVKASRRHAGDVYLTQSEARRRVDAEVLRSLRRFCLDSAESIGVYIGQGRRGLERGPAVDTFAHVSTISSRAIWRWYAPRAPIVAWQASVDVCRIGPAGTGSATRTASIRLHRALLAFGSEPARRR